MNQIIEKEKIPLSFNKGPLNFSITENDRDLLSQGKTSELITARDNTTGEEKQFKLQLTKSDDDTINVHFLNNHKEFFVPKNFDDIVFTKNDIDDLVAGKNVGPFTFNGQEYWCVNDKDINRINVVDSRSISFVDHAQFKNLILNKDFSTLSNFKASGLELSPESRDYLKNDKSISKEDKIAVHSIFNYPLDENKRNLDANHPAIKNHNNKNRDAKYKLGQAFTNAVRDIGNAIE